MTYQWTLKAHHINLRFNSDLMKFLLFPTFFKTCFFFIEKKYAIALSEVADVFRRSSLLIETPDYCCNILKLFKKVVQFRLPLHDQLIKKTA